MELRSILVGLGHPDGGIVPICSCGNLGSARNRQDLYDRLKPAEVDCQAAAGVGGCRAGGL